MIEIKRAVEAATALSPRAKSVAEDTIFRSPFPDIEMENHLLLHDYCLWSGMPQRQHRPCIIDGITGKIHSYGEVGAMAAAMARGLIQKAGLRKGDVIMLLLCNSAEFVISFLASSMAATVATTANPFCTPSDIAKQCAASATKLIITTAACVPKLQNLDAHVTIVTTDEPPTGSSCMRFSELLLHADLGHSSDATQQLAETFSGKLQLVGRCDKDLDFELPRAEVDDTVALPFSSGTTGLPKGVMLTHKSLVTGVAQQVDGENPLWNLSQHDVTLCVLPLFHIYAMSTLMLCSLRAGAAILILPKFDMATLLQSVQRHRVTIAAVVPPIVLAMAKNELADEYDLSSVRLVMSGAAPLGSELEGALARRLPNAVFGQGYGMTEAGPVLSLSPAFARTPLRPSKAGSCGCVVRCAEIKVVDQHSGVALPRNRSGEICIRGAQIMKGYLNNPEATAQTIDADGWLHTGDVGLVDDDDHVFLLDRVKEIIKFKGFQVAPAELEALLLTHPSIADAAVVPMKNEVAGEVPVAFVVKKEGLQGESVTEEQIRQMVAKQVVYYKRLYRVFFTDFIPKSTAGKILRKNLKERLEHLQ